MWHITLWEAITAQKNGCTNFLNLIIKLTNKRDKNERQYFSKQVQSSTKILQFVSRPLPRMLGNNVTILY